MDAAVAESPSPAIGYTGRSIESRVSVIEGTIKTQDRIFDMLHEGQQNLRADIAGLRAETNASIGEMRDDMDKRFGEVDSRIAAMDVRINERINETNERINETNERIAAMELGVNERIAAMDSQLNTKIDSNLKWILGVQIAMWVTIIVAVLL